MKLGQPHGVLERSGLAASGRCGQTEERRVTVRTDFEQGSIVAQTPAKFTNANQTVWSGERVGYTGWSLAGPDLRPNLASRFSLHPPSPHRPPPTWCRRSPHEARPTSCSTGLVGAGGERSRWVGARSALTMISLDPPDFPRGPTSPPRPPPTSCRRSTDETRPTSRHAGGASGGIAPRSGRGRRRAVEMADPLHLGSGAPHTPKCTDHDLPPASSPPSRPDHPRPTPARRPLS
jgi:hypothetical protein